MKSRLDEENSRHPEQESKNIGPGASVAEEKLMLAGQEFMHAEEKLRLAGQDFKNAEEERSDAEQESMDPERKFKHAQRWRLRR